MRQLDNLRRRCRYDLQLGPRSKEKSMMKRIGIVDPGGWGHELGAKAHDNGCEVVVFSAEVDGRRVKAALRDSVKIVVVDTNDAAALAAAVGQMHHAPGGKLDALISGRDPNIVSVASIARRLALVAPRPLRPQPSRHCRRNSTLGIRVFDLSRRRCTHRRRPLTRAGLGGALDPRAAIRRESVCGQQCLAANRHLPSGA